MATMRMYCPSLKKNVEATITDGKRVASKGGSLRNILYGEYEGRKCLPKTVKAEVFAQHGFAAEFHLKEDFTEGIDDDMIAIHNEKGKRVGMVSVENAGGDDDVNVAITYPVSPPFYTGALKEKTVLVGDEAYDIRSAESTFEAEREDLICDYCERIISPGAEAVNWPDSGLTVCGGCFDDETSFEAEKSTCRCGKDISNQKCKMCGSSICSDCDGYYANNCIECFGSRFNAESFCSSCGSHKQAEGCGCMAAETFGADEYRNCEICESSHHESEFGYSEDEEQTMTPKGVVCNYCFGDIMFDDFQNADDRDWAKEYLESKGFPANTIEGSFEDRFGAETFEAEKSTCRCGKDISNQKCKMCGSSICSDCDGYYVNNCIECFGSRFNAESSPSSFDISWEDAQGVSSPSLPPEGIHFAEQEGECEVCFAKNDGTGNLTQCNRCEKQICLGDMDACSSICGECGTYCCDACLMSNENCANCDASYRAEQGKNIKFCNGCNKRTNFEDGECSFCAFPEFGAEGEYSATMCDSCEAIYPEDDEGDVCECGGTIRNLYEYEDGSADFESEYHLNGETCEHCSEEVQLNAEGFCSECYEDLYLSETMAAEGISRNGKLVLGLTALGFGMAMALGSERVASLLDKFNRK